MLPNTLQPNTRLSINLSISLALAVALAGCATTPANQQQVNVVHLTRPASDAADPNAPSLSNPTQTGYVITGTANLEQQHFVRIENPDGYAPDQPVEMIQQADTSADLPASASGQLPRPSDDAQAIVEPGDTVYSIARANDMDANQLANINNLDANYTIYPGQLLILHSNEDNSNQLDTDISLADQPGTPPSSPLSSPPSSPLSSPPSSPPPEAAADWPQREVEGIRWSWPLVGKPNLLRSFNASDKTRGIDLDGKPGEAVYASSDGAVVYAGNELKGYGNLVIISHAKNFMTAYAHNSRLLVSADDQVERGQKIAEMGSVESNRVKLFFQLRHRGEPVDPLGYLPKQ